MSPIRISLLAVLSVLALAAPASAAGWHGYGLYNRTAPVEHGTGTHSVRLTSIVLPDAFKVKRAATSLSFGPVGACRSTGTVRPALVASTAASAGAVLDELAASGTTYGSGSRSSGAVFRVVKLSGGSIRAVSVSPTRLAGIWVVVRASTTPHTTCHTGGVRESLGFPLVDAFATIRANGY